jgi:predicted O-methyltransferase YrrM
MNILQRGIQKVRRSVERRKNLARLERRHDPASRAVAQSIRGTLAGALTSPENEEIAKIETLRLELDSSKEPITRTDFGAGRGDSNRSQEEMKRGNEVTDALGDISRLASKNPLEARLLFLLLRRFEPLSCLELGTSVGISACYQGAALRLNGKGRLITLEGAPPLADVARRNFDRLGLTNVEVLVGRFDETLSPTLDRARPLDYVFIDGHHDEQATLRYFEVVLPALAERAVVVFDDIAWSDGMKRAWQAIGNDRRVALAVDLGAVGVCVVDRSPSGAAQSKFYRIPLS